MEPYIEWYEDSRQIFFRLEYSPIKNQEITIDNNYIYIYFEIGDTETIIFKKQLVLNAEIIKEKSSYKLIKDQNNISKISFTLEKKYNISWENLSKEKDNKIKIDWANWNYNDVDNYNVFEIPNISHNSNKNSLIQHFNISDSNSGSDSDSGSDFE